MFIGQPEVATFGAALRQEFESGVWEELRIAVAWVRRSGIQHISDDVRQFLDAGGRCWITTGIDFSNTTKEGLDGLVSLCEYSANFKAFAYHNEGGPTFHPKFYLFSNKTNCRLFVGSNNLTESGLYTNTEATLCVDLPPGDPVVASAKVAFEKWSDISDGVCKALDAHVVNELSENGYVKSEEQVRRESSSSRAVTRNRMFASKSVSAAPPISKLKVQVKEPKASANLPSSGRRAAGNGRFWIETGKLTGGSRNQLDLSMAGVNNVIPGSIALFGINPANTNSNTDITIRYKGIDYTGNTIKFPRSSGGHSNGTWRLQLNGRATNGAKLTQQCSGFIDSILEFRPRGPNHYEIIEVESNATLSKYKEQSTQWDRNRPAGRHFGRL